MIEAFEKAKAHILEKYNSNPVEGFETFYDVLNSKDAGYFAKIRALKAKEEIQRDIEKDIYSYLETLQLKGDSVCPTINRDGTISLDKWFSYYLQPIQTFKSFELRDSYIEKFNPELIKLLRSDYDKIYELFDKNYRSQNYKELKTLLNFKKMNTTTSEENEAQIKDLQVKVTNELLMIMRKYKLVSKGFEFEISLKKTFGIQINSWPAYDAYKHAIEESIFTKDSTLFNSFESIWKFMKERGF
ncbi:hypothetical protein CG473_02170 [Mycoplasma testudineum]|nr:hypothetical protein CG473_02170 [Mycoplasma testudineum]